MNKHRAAIIDAVGALLLFSITAYAITRVRAGTDSSKLILALISLNTALIVARIRIHIDQRASELTALSEDLDRRVSEHLRLFAPGRALGHLVEMAIIKNSSEASDLVREFKKACDTLRDIVDFVYRVSAEEHALYYHDIKKIEKLRKGEYYRATHAFDAMKGVWNGDDSSEPAFALEESAMFQSYMNEQYKARERGVNVVRIYIANDIDVVFKSAKIVRHFQEMCEKGITVRIIERKRLTPGKQEDFIIIGNALLGLGKTEDGHVVEALYSKNDPASPRELFDEYSAYFKALEGISSDCKELLKKHRKPAGV